MKFSYRCSHYTKEGLKTVSGTVIASDEGSAELNAQKKVAKELKLPANYAENLYVSLYQIR